MKSIPAAVALAIALAVPAPSQTVVEEPRILPSDAAGGLTFGWEVALLGDELYVGAPNDLGKSPFLGAIYRFQLGPGGWTEVETLRPMGSYLGDRFGIAVAVDTNTLVGATWSSPVGTELVVFERQGTAWTETSRIATPSTPANSALRPNVAVQGDTIAVGIPGYSGGIGFPSQIGRAVVIERTGVDWSQHTTQILAAPDGNPGDMFGTDVDFDESRLLVGASGTEPPGVFNQDWGSVYLYERGPSQFDLVEQIVAPIPETDGFFGESVAICGDLILGGRPGMQSSGAVDVLRDVNGVWQLDQTLFPQNPPGFLRFGESLGFADGRLAIGAPMDGPGGAVYLYTLEGGAFTFRERIVPGGSLFGLDFGRSIAVGAGRVLAGAHGASDFGSFTGAAHSFEVVTPPPPAVYCTAKPTVDGCSPSIGSTGTAALTGEDDFTVDCTDVAPQKTGLFFYGTSGPTALPFLGGTLCVLPPLSRTIPQAAGGAGTCGGTYSFAFSQALFALEGLAPGALVHGQWWLRDPQNPDGTGVALSNGIAIELGI